MNRSVKLGDFMTNSMLRQAQKLISITQDSSKWAELIGAHIIAPHLNEINQKLGQENDARYLAYAVVYGLTAARR